MGTLRLFLTGLFLVLALTLTAQEETIEWTPNVQLSWSDFKADSPVNPRAAAITASGISYMFSSIQQGDEMKIDFTVTTFFYPQKSWYQPQLCDENILSHEQLHFDISELFARKFRHLLATTRFSRNIKAEVKRIYARINRELAEFQDQYDRETNFSRNVEAQMSWNRRIAQELGK